MTEEEISITGNNNTQRLVEMKLQNIFLFEIVFVFDFDCGEFRAYYMRLCTDNIISYKTEIFRRHSDARTLLLFNYITSDQYIFEFERSNYIK